MVALLAESIPVQTKAWAMMWLIVLSLVIIGFFAVVWIITRLRIHRHLGAHQRNTSSSPDPWAESAVRLRPGGEDPPAVGEPDES
jgi:hypothetical protein